MKLVNQLKNNAAVVWMMLMFASASVWAQGTNLGEAMPQPDHCAASAKVVWLPTQLPGHATASMISVKAPRACAWTVQSKAPWIKFHRTEFRGNAVFSFKLEMNPQAPRTGEIMLAGQTFAITQNQATASSAVLTATANPQTNAPAYPAGGGGGVPQPYGSAGFYGSNSASGGTNYAAGGNVPFNGTGVGMGAPAMPIVLPQLANLSPSPTTRWARIEDSQPVATIVTAKDQLYQLRKNGMVLRYTAKEEWEMIDNDPNTRVLVAWQNRVYQWCLNKGVLVWNEDAKRWNVFDAEAKALAVTTNYLYTLSHIGLWQYNGKTWSVIENGFTTHAIAATKDNLYQWRHKQGVWEFNETARQWKQIDTTVELKGLTAHGRDLYQTRMDGSLWWYTGIGWQKEQGTIPTKVTLTTEKAIYHLDESGYIWRATIG